MKRTITISRAKATELNAILATESGKLPKEKQDQTLWTQSVSFGNNIEADIQVCSGQENAYLNPVLFQSGMEVACLQDESESVEGEYPFEYQGKEYTVVVKVKD